MAPKIERVTEGVVFGEGPHWDVTSQSLYFVDMNAQNILRYVPSSNTLHKASVAPQRPAFIIPVEGSTDRFVVGLDNKLAIVSWNGTDGTSSVIETLCTTDEPDEIFDYFLNDAKCDSSGRLWAGTFGKGRKGFVDTPCGTLYTYDRKRQLKGQVDKVRMTNGLAFNDEAKRLYYIDTLEGRVDQFDIDVSTGSISNRQPHFTLSNHGIAGLPDGMTIDSDGNLWVAVFSGGKILKVSGKDSETLLDSIEMPGPQVTSMSFGGPNLDELYVTTGAIEFKGQKPLPPVNGNTYRITGTGAKGLPGVNFRLH